MSGTFAVGFDPVSLGTISRLQGFEGLLDPRIEAMLQAAGELVAQTAQANTWLVFDNPTGALADSIGVLVAGLEEVDVVVGVPYGMRREFGFEGMYDSLGRGPFNDPAKPYLEPAVGSDLPLIRSLAEESIIAAWGSI